MSRSMHISSANVYKNVIYLVNITVTIKCEGERGLSICIFRFDLGASSKVQSRSVSTANIFRMVTDLINSTTAIRYELACRLSII